MRESLAILAAPIRTDATHAGACSERQKGRYALPVHVDATYAGACSESICYNADTWI